MPIQYYNCLLTIFFLNYITLLYIIKIYSNTNFFFIGSIGEKGSVGAPGQPGITGSVVSN